jgi:hypothetical protein
MFELGRIFARENSSSTNVVAVRSWVAPALVMSPCGRAWAPERGGLAGMCETKRILRRSGVIDPHLGRSARSGGALSPRSQDPGGGGASGGCRREKLRIPNNYFSPAVPSNKRTLLTRSEFV